ncbi:hypothetical protein [Streptomyces sp. NBC_00859]|uniref:hypothetical protein n=1 Tax=Streptomyces sp. NBC_00859 TaxID=2903682 RepID=UPI00386DFED8|nr:hypothetical protein OG584_02100 [Streptomyces sp. NBC_00859]
MLTDSWSARPDQNGLLGRLRRRCHALGAEGPARHSLLLIGKSTLAASVAWAISFYLMDATSPAFAPFSAVVIMHVTVYQSVVQSLRYVGAVVAGVAVQAALGFLAGPDLLSFVLVAAVALSIARWSLLGVQGPQVATAAFFAFATYSSASDASTRIAQLAQIVLLVVVGCVVGTAVNLLVAPPMRYRSAEHSVRVLAGALHGLASDIPSALRDGAPDGEATTRWRQQAADTGGMITQAREGLHTARESVYYNPRGLLRRHREHVVFDGYEAVLAALERALYQMASLTRSLDQWQEPAGPVEYRDFLRRYASLLDAVAEAALALSTLDEATLPQQSDRLSRLAGEALEHAREVAEAAAAENLPLSDPRQPYGVLVIEGARLAEEIQYTSDMLRSWVAHD